MINTAKAHLAMLHTSWLSVLVFLFGGFDGLFRTLLILMAADYVSGLIKGFTKKNINSKRAYKGIRKKLLILIIVIAGTAMDSIVPGLGIRTLILMFYASTEFLSVIENAASFGLPIPKKLRVALEQLQEK